MTTEIKKLHREAMKLARETYEDGVSDERLAQIEARLTEIDRLIYG